MKKGQTGTYLVYLFLVLPMLFWGTSYVFTSIALHTLDPISIIFIRLLLSSAMLWLFIAVFCRKEKIPRSVFKWIVLLAFLEPFIYFIGETYGLQHVSPVVTSLIISTIPVFTAIVMRCFFHARLSWVNFAGIFISLAGVVIMITENDRQLAVDLPGILFLMLALFSAVGYGILLNKLASDVHPVWLIAFQNTCGVLFFLPLLFLLGQTPDFNHPVVIASLSAESEMWICIILLSVFSSSLAFIFYSIGVGRLGIARCNVFTNLIPVFTALTSFFLLDERFSSAKIAGIVVVLLGLILTQIKLKIEN
ncbi:MAG: DMT family transporter [Bacteroidales bacterium]|jgi:drug/metabolite transporter (DMT)-like permease|nr:DMT family transporter [Bacteroidales bacterium]